MLHCTLKHVHHAEEGQGERGFAAARPATDPHLKTHKSESPTFKSQMLFHLFTQFGYLLPRADVCIDIFEHWLQRGIVSDTQILDLDLSVSGPAIRNLRHG